MYIYWHNGALRLQPEGKVEQEAISLLVQSAKVGVPPEFRDQCGGPKQIQTGSCL
jgi:hypothetical protein